MESPTSSLVIFQVMAIAFVVAVVFLWINYRKYLLKALRSGSFNGSFILFHDKTILKIISNGLKSEKPEVKAYYLRISEEISIKNWRDYLIEALFDDNADIKDYVLHRIAELHMKSAASQVLKLVQDAKQDSQIRNKAAYVYCLLSDKHDVLNAFGNLILPEIAEGVISGFLFFEDKELSFIAMQKLGEMISCSDENIRATAARIIGIVGADKKDFVYPLTLLTYDESQKVKKQVIISVSKIKSPLFVDYLIKRLSDSDCRRKAFSALISIGKEAIPPLCKAIMDGTQKTNILLYLVEIIGRIMGNDGKDALMLCLSKTKNRRVRDEILKVLTFHSVTIEKSYVGVINTLLSRETKNAITLLTAMLVISRDEKIMLSDFGKILISAFENDISMCKSRIISLCNLVLLPRDKISSDNICEKENYDTLKANGIKLKKIELYSKASPAVILSRIDRNYNPNEKNTSQQLENIILSDAENTTKWLRACCCYAAFLTEGKKMKKIYEVARNDVAQIVRETAIYALSNLDKEKD